MPTPGRPRKTHCIRGHDLRYARVKKLTAPSGKVYTYRQCAECHLIHVRDSQLRHGTNRRTLR